MSVRCTSRPVRFEHGGREWTASELERLRRARFRRAAWRGVVVRSLARAREQRAARARAHRQVLASAGLGLAARAAAALAGEPLPALVAAAWWTGVVLMLDWHLGLLERPDGGPLDGLGLANGLTLGRAALVPVLPFVPPVVLAAALRRRAGDGRRRRVRGARVRR